MVTSVESIKNVSRVTTLSGLEPPPTL